MITEIALITAATGVIAGISYALVKTCAADKPQPAPTPERYPRASGFAVPFGPCGIRYSP